MIGFVNGAVVGARAGFAGAKVARAPAKVASKVSMMAKSEAVPFLEAPEGLPSGVPGYKGFDPLELSNYLDQFNARTAEIKHGRICMLASIGWLVQEVVQLPGEVHSETHALAAIYKAPIEGWWQIIFVICLVELFTFDKTYNGTTPGDYGFDPLGLGKDSSKIASLQEAEILNGRLAMIGWTGFLFQQLVTGQGVIEQLTNFKPIA
mmetsp:Transcript_24225/g.59097  ORF Transcript_24225/g.59097 Transcript_24225/m.59097 type:complete len:207 (+) Transcript_24225:191-811(+)